MTDTEETNQRLPRVGSAVVVIDGRGWILVGVRLKDPNRGKWVLPGGKVRPFETINGAARREVLEETGIEIELEGVLTVHEVIHPPDEHRIIMFSRGRPVGGELRAGSDLGTPTFFAPRDLVASNLSDVVRNVLSETGMIPSRPLSRGDGIDANHFTGG